MTNPQPPSSHQLAADVAAAEDSAIAAVARAGSAAELDRIQSEVIGKRSALARLNTALGALDPEGRRSAGASINAARSRVGGQIEQRRSMLAVTERRARIEAERLDLTETIALASTTGGGVPLPGGPVTRGRLNLVTQTRDELEDTFVALGFAVAEGPEAETDWYNFEALNMPPAHPARGMWDTLYLKLGKPETVLLRTHTSPVQVRLMERQKPPIYAVMPGRCYRRDTPDARHLPVFHQIEGLVSTGT